MCCPTTRQSSVKNLLVFVVKVTLVHTTTTAKTGGGAPTNTNTGALFYSICSFYLTADTCQQGSLAVCCFHRALPCPAVKQSEEWGDPSKCEGAEGCQYCHTRTEQQFHPEVCMFLQIFQSNSRPKYHMLICRFLDI